MFSSITHNKVLFHFLSRKDILVSYKVVLFAITRIVLNYMHCIQLQEVCVCLCVKIHEKLGAPTYC